MQLFTIAIAIISFVQAAAIPLSANGVITSGQNVEENISSNEEQADWMVEFNEYLNGDDFTFDLDTFMAKMSDDEVEEFIDFFTLILDEELSEDYESLQA